MSEFDYGSLKKPFEADWPVKVPVAQDGGSVATKELVARFRLRPQNRLGEILQETATDPKADANTLFLREAVVGLKGVATEEFAETLEDLISWPHTRSALNRAYAEFSTGSPAKN